MKKAIALLLILPLLCGCAEALGETGLAEGGTTIVSPKDEFDFVVVISDPGWKYETSEDGVRISRLTETPDMMANIMIASGPAADVGESTDPRTAVTGFMRNAIGESNPFISSWDVNGGYEGAYSYGIVPDSGAVLRAVMWLVGDRMYIAAIYEMGVQLDAEAVFLEVLNTFRPAPDEPAAATAAPTNTPEVRSPVNTPKVSGKGLEVVWDTTKTIKPGYSLLIDGKKLDWNNTLNSAVQVFKDNGFEVYPVSESQANLEKQNIVFCNTIPVRFVRVGKNTKDDGLNSVSMILDSATDFESTVAMAEDLNQKLQNCLGSVRRTMKIYMDDKNADVSDLDARSAMNKAFSSGADYVLVSIEYNESLNIYIQPRKWNDKLFYDFEISLASWH